LHIDCTPNYNFNHNLPNFLIHHSNPGIRSFSHSFDSTLANSVQHFEQDLIHFDSGSGSGHARNHSSSFVVANLHHWHFGPNSIVGNCNSHLIPTYYSNPNFRRLVDVTDARNDSNQPPAQGPNWQSRRQA